MSVTLTMTLTMVFGVLAFVLAAAAFAVALGVARGVSGSARSATRRRGGKTEGQEDGLAQVPEDLLGLRQEVAALRAEVAHSVRHVAVVRYDAFPDSGGRLSWSAALLDDDGDGLVLTAIHGRQDARTYAKSIAGWTGEQLSAEEGEAVDRARD